jgi:hypothetical protein
MMTPTPYCNFELVFSCEPHSASNVCGSGAANDQPGMAVNQAIPDFSCHVVLRIFPNEKHASKLCPEILDC